MKNTVENIVRQAIGIGVSVGILASMGAMSSAAAQPQEACLLSAAQISAAVKTPVADGAYMGSLKKTCTWMAVAAAPRSVKFVTLLLQDTVAFEGGKHLGSDRLVVTAVSGIGDDAYFLSVGDQVGLIVKKDDAAFKVTVYADLPAAAKQSMEKALALNAASKL